MKPTNFALEFSVLQEYLLSRRVGWRDLQAIQEFKDEVIEEELNDRQNRLEREYPIQSFLMRYDQPIGVVLGIATILIFSLSMSKGFAGWRMIILSSILFFSFVYFARVTRELSSEIIPWGESPFAEFQEEYSGEVVSKAFSPFDSDPYARSCELRVISHPFSRSRFLFVYDPVINETECVDYWEKSETVPEFVVEANQVER